MRVFAEFTTKNEGMYVVSNKERDLFINLRKKHTGHLRYIEIRAELRI